MATKSKARTSKANMNTKVNDITRSSKGEMKSSHLSTLMMLSSQLLSDGRFNKGLPAFVIRGLDSEQIWQQLELRNDHKLALAGCTKEIVAIQKRKSSKRKRKCKEENKKVEQSTGNVSDEDLDGSDKDVDETLYAIKKRLVGNEVDGNEEVDLHESDDDELDFDFAVEKELSKRLSDGEDDEDSENESSEPKSQSKQNVKKRTTVVDDKFFKMADMEEFLDAEDLKEEKKLRGGKKGQEDELSSEDEEEDDKDIDMFAADSDDGDDEAAEAKYSDFFDPVDEENCSKDKETDGENEDIASKKDQLKRTKKSKGQNMVLESDESEDEDEDNKDNEVREHEIDFEDEVCEDDEEDADTDEQPEHHKDSSDEKENKNFKKKVSFPQDLLRSDDDDADDKSDLRAQEPKSNFELKQERLLAKARQMEELSLKDPSWELTGETSSMKRPENSLLETVLDFQHTTRSAPVITDDTTKSLEDFIKQRIRDKTFDDVERKEKPKEDVFEFKKRIVLDQEKSKQSLGELYEQEFLKQQQQDKEEVKADPECEKIESELNKLFFQLDALCNFHYTPMKPGSEVKIVVNTPAISMEEVAPVATADSDLLAPEEVHDKRKGDLKADDERDSTDKKRARRQKKLEKREKKKAKEAREKLVDKLKPGLGNKYSKVKALKQLEEISKSNRNITMIKGDKTKLASSTAFFSQLQEEVQTNVKAKKGVLEKKKKKVDPSKLML